MKDFKISVKELILSNKKNPFGCETFVYEPSNIEEELLGSLYIIGWVKKDERDLEFLPNLIASIAKREFFKLNHSDPELSFEICLKKINSTLFDLEKEHDDLRGKISLFILNIKDDVMQFSKLGNQFMYLFRAGSIINIGGKKTRKKTFSAVVTGNISLGDKFIFASPEVENLFIDRSLSSVLSQDINSQADLIHELYLNFSKEYEIPSQAAILLSVESNDKKKSFKKVFRSVGSISSKKLEKKHKLFLSLFLDFFKKKKWFILLILFFSLLLVSISFYVKASAINSSLMEVSVRIEEANEKPKDEAINILNDAKKIASSLYAYPFLSSKIESAKKDIDKKIEEVNGVFNIKAEEVSIRIPGKSFSFKPEYIYEKDGIIYIFGDSLNAFYKIENNEKVGSFVFLDKSDFYFQRSFEDDSNIYFINYKDRIIFSFSKEDEKLIELTEKNKKRKLLRYKPTQFEKEFNESLYFMEKNKIVKKNKDEEKFINFLNLIRIKSFTVSGDDRYLYLLSERKVFRSYNK